MDALTEIIGLAASLITITVVIIKVIKEHKSRVANLTVGLWQRTRRAVVAAFAAHWRKAVIALTVVWVVGGVLAYGHTTGWVHNDGPLWSMAWLGSLSLAVWLYAGWLAVCWTTRQIRRLLP